MKYYIIAGEASGDMHAAGVLKALRVLDAGATFRAWGGERMEAEGACIVKHYRDLAFMGFLEVAKNLPTIIRNFRLCKRDMLTFQPDALILVDYPGFNLRMAAFAHRKGIPVFYYISPQVWAWKKSRVKQIRQTVDRMFVILPFEQEFYANYGYDVEYVGHPLVETIAAYHAQQVKVDDPLDRIAAGDKPMVAMLPGSREQEVRAVLPIMLEMTRRFCDVQFVLAEAPSIPAALYDDICRGYELKRLRNRTYDVLAESQVAMVTSGTASLESALFGLPEVICYKGNAVSFAIAKRLVKIPYIGLPNLILKKAVARELIQHDFNPDTLEGELFRLLYDAAYHRSMRSEFQHLAGLLKGPGASMSTARGIYQFLTSRREKEHHDA